MLEKDPKNKFDPNAIQVRRLGGEDLGFVPKELTRRFPHDVTFGHIHHVGQVPKIGLWGALVNPLPSTSKSMDASVIGMPSSYQTL